MMVIKELTNTEEKLEAAALLYKVYVEIGEWYPLPDNPSKLVIAEHNGRKVLIDKFTESAIFYGAYDEDGIIGCIRLNGPDADGKLEVEGYTTSAAIWPYLPQDRNKCRELNKLAVAPRRQNLGVANKLILAACKYCLDNKYRALAYTSNSYSKKIFATIKYPLKISNAFKYEDRDDTFMNFYLAEVSDLKHMVKCLELISHDNLVQSAKVFRSLEEIADIFPAPMYWHSVDGVVLGANEHTLQNMNKTADQVIGCKPHDFYPEDIANHILEHNNKIMTTGEPGFQEEWVIDPISGSKRCFMAAKAPLYDEHGNILGILGSSIETTAQKEAERLRLENAVHKVAAKEQEKFRELVGQMHHDMRSPVMSLDALSREIIHALPEEQRIILRTALNRINDISNFMVRNFEPGKQDEAYSDNEKHEPVLVVAALLEIISEKRYEYHDQAVEFIHTFDSENAFTFINMVAGSFSRAVSNLINNAIDAFHNKTGTVTISLNVVNQKVNIVISDNGKGMPDEIRQKILDNIAVTNGKEHGHGIGFGQISDMLSANDGTLDIESKSGIGTKITLTFPQIASPKWIADKIELQKDDLVIVVDDDQSIHGAWNSKIKRAVPNLEIKHFKSGAEAITFINQLSKAEKIKVILLTDYELIGQNLNGIDIVQQTQIKRSILVTSHYATPRILEQAAKINLKILPKLLAPDVSINLVDSVQSKNSNNSNPKSTKLENDSSVLKIVDIIVADDDRFLVKTMLSITLKDKNVAVYHTAEEFLANFNQYAKNTPMLIDHQFKGEKVDGIEICTKLYEAGYSNFYLYSGRDFAPEDLPHYLRYILKTDIDAIIRIFE